MSDWQPIESAPDGKDVLLFRIAGAPPVVAGRFDEAWETWDGKYIPDDRVTHWMPLPEPPGLAAMNPQEPT